MVFTATSLSSIAIWGAIVGSVLIVVLAGLPWRLIQNLRTEREENERLLRERTQEVADRDVLIADLRAKTDVSSIHAKLETLESGMAGGFAALARHDKEMVKLLGALAEKLGQPVPSR